MSKIQKDVPLKNYSNYKIGGNASYFLDVRTKEDLIEGLREWRQMGENKEIFILGGGTNILISDDGFDGLIIHCSIEGIELNGEELTVGAGESIWDIDKFLVEKSLSGMEWSGGLPGTIGGAVRGNAGAFSGETKDVVSKVQSIDLETLEEKERDNKDCEFSYRNSIFKKNGDKELIFSVTLSLRKGERDEIEERTLRNVQYRQERHPLEYPNIGSTFKNIPWDNVPEDLKVHWKVYLKDDPFPVVPVAKIIALAGLKGTTVGKAMVSDKHTNFIVNLGNAKASDVKGVIEEVKDKVKDKFGVNLEEEVMYLN